MKNGWTDRLDNGQKIIVSQLGGAARRVECPLPDGFGISTGSAFSDPFNQNVLDGPKTSKIGTVLSAATGVSRKVGFGTKIYYSGPEPTEISFDMQFDAFYSAREEVVLNAMKLMYMSVGQERSVEELLNSAPEGAKEVVREEAGGLFSGTVGNLLETASREVGLIFSPEICRIQFGNVMRINAAYITSAGVRFSNVLDNEFMPQSATVSVTAKLERNPTRAEVLEFFKPSGARL